MSIPPKLDDLLGGNIRLVRHGEAFVVLLITPHRVVRMLIQQLLGADPLDGHFPPVASIPHVMEPKTLDEECSRPDGLAAMRWAKQHVTALRLGSQHVQDGLLPLQRDNFLRALIGSQLTQDAPPVSGGHKVMVCIHKLFQKLHVSEANATSLLDRVVSYRSISFSKPFVKQCIGNADCCGSLAHLAVRDVAFGPFKEPLVPIVAKPLADFRLNPKGPMRHCQTNSFRSDSYGNRGHWQEPWRPQLWQTALIQTPNPQASCPPCLQISRRTSQLCLWLWS